MEYHRLKNEHNGEVLFEGHYKDIKTCLEDAVQNNIILKGVDLAGANLFNAELDGAQFVDCKFDNANLLGANLCEALFENCTFAGSQLQSSFWCFSNMNNCDFSYTSFAGTDISGTHIKNSRFAAPSTFNLNFIDCEVISNCHYFQDNICYHFDKPPVRVSGLAYPIIRIGAFIKIGSQIKSPDEWQDIANTLCPEKILQDGRLYNFLKINILLIEALLPQHNTLESISAA